MAKSSSKKKVSYGILFLAFLFSISPSTSAENSVTSLSVAGFEVTWPKIMYMPSGCSQFEFGYSNGAPYELLKVGFTLTDPYGDSITNDSLIGAPPGRSGIWNKQICNFSLKNGLGPYRIKVYVEDYSSRGGGSAQQYADVYFTSRPGTKASSTPAAPSPSTSAENSVTSLSVAGFEVTWPKIMYMPSGCSQFEFGYSNGAPYELLKVGFTLTDPYGDSITNDSLIGAPPGRSGIWNKQICNFSLKNGLGPYRIKVYVEDYSSRGGGSAQQYADVYFTSRPGTKASSTPTAPGVNLRICKKKIGNKAKGNRIITVTGVKPRCPTGYSKVR